MTQARGAWLETYDVNAIRPPGTGISDRSPGGADMRDTDPETIAQTMTGSSGAMGVSTPFSAGTDSRIPVAQ